MPGFPSIDDPAGDASTEASVQRRFIEEPICPDFIDHQPGPPGYIQWHAWAKKMSKTHRQLRCPTCRLFTIWVPK